MGRNDFANWIWAAGTAPVVIGLLVSMIRDLQAGRMGVDAIAFVSMSAALILGENLALCPPGALFRINAVGKLTGANAGQDRKIRKPGAVYRGSNRSKRQAIDQKKVRSKRWLRRAKFHRADFSSK
jgi:hypothetical protein